MPSRQMKEKRSKRTSDNCSGNPTPAEQRHPYLLFLYDLRRLFPNISSVEVIREGAKFWRLMTTEMKLKYIEAAYHALRRRGSETTQQQRYSNKKYFKGTASKSMRSPIKSRGWERKYKKSLKEKRNKNKFR